MINSIENMIRSIQVENCG